MVSESTPRVLTIDITMDPICGFSYIAYKRVKNVLNHLVQEHGQIRAVIRHHPYILDPTLPECGNSISPEVILKKNNIYHTLEQVIEGGQSCDMESARDRPIGQTIDIQRLLLYSLRHLGAAFQFQLLGLIFQLSFDMKQDVYSTTSVAALACRPIPCPDGTSRAAFQSCDEALVWVQSGELRDEVIESGKKAREQGVKAIPFLVLNGKYAICGARDEEIYFDIFRKAIFGEL